ncbi:hypothetical protein ACWGPC_54205, partial [Streptomyces mirabilis]
PRGTYEGSDGPPWPGIRQQRNKRSAPVPLKTLESCAECFDGTPADPTSYIAPPAKHLLAA